MAGIKRPLSARREERDLLGRISRSQKAEFVAIYGRRRVGKTFLVRRYFQDQAVTYFEMIGQFEGSVEDQLRIFAESLSATFYGSVALAQPTSWHDAFRMLQRAIDERPQRGRKCVLFFDELPWIATHRSGCLRELEHFWNAWCSGRDDIVVVVCGSAASWMLAKIVNARGGLHGRLTQTIRLLPLTLPETREFFDDRKIRFTDRELMELYMVFGGVPHYLDHVVRGRSVAQQVDRICLHKDGALAGEFGRLFASLFADDSKYVEVVRALAKKRQGLSRNDLLSIVQLPSGGGASTVLDNLAEGGFITATIPFGRATRDRFYRLTDELSLFHLSWLDKRAPGSWQMVRNTPRWRAWVGLAFESLCLKHVGAIERALGIAGVRTESSAWLAADAQIDLLIDRADDVISLCEVKFTDGPYAITKKYAAELRNKIEAFRRHTGTNKALHLVFITSYGLVQNAYSEELVDQTITMDALVA